MIKRHNDHRIGLNAKHRFYKELTLDQSTKNAQRLLEELRKEKL